jgi:predicted nucleotidyltransferase
MAKLIGMDLQLRRALETVIAAGPPSRFVVLFGSRARGVARADSDLDLAWLPVDAAISLGAELGFQAELTRAAGCEVDLVRVDLASTICRMEIARDAVLVSGEVADLQRFQAEATIEYLDFAPALRDATERYRRFLAAAPSRSAP